MTIPAATRVSAWLWAVSAAAGAAAFVISSLRDGIVAVSGDAAFDVLTLAFLTITVGVVWGLRVWCAVLLARRGSSAARAVLLVMGLLVGLVNDVVGAARAGGALLVVVLAGVDLALILAATALMYRPTSNAYVAAALARRGQAVQDYLHTRPAPTTTPATPPAAPGPGVIPAGWRPTNTMAILALIFAFVFAPLGPVFGFVARSQIKHSGEAGRGLALAGIIIGLLYLLFIAGFFIVVATSGPSR